MPQSKQTHLRSCLSVYICIKINEFGVQGAKGKCYSNLSPESTTERASLLSRGTTYTADSKALGLNHYRAYQQKT